MPIVITFMSYLRLQYSIHSGKEIFD